MNRYFTLFCLCLLSTFRLNSQTPGAAEGVMASHMQKLGVSKPLRDLPIHFSHRKNEEAKEIPNFKDNVQMPRLNAANALPKNGDPLRQLGEAKNSGDVVLPILNIEGQYDDPNNPVMPPDPAGAVGLDYYLQLVNGPAGTLFIVVDKQGNTVYGPNDLNSFWAQFGLTGLGDPIVMYDQEAQRWIMTEFANSFSDNTMMLAVSSTSDPLGEWYSYRVDANSFPDYPKYAKWGDAYLITTNENDDKIPVYALNRQQILNGDANPAIQRVPTIPKINGSVSFQVAAPVDWDGATPPPAGSPLMAMRMHDDAWDGGVDQLEIWEVQIDWANPNNTTVNGPIALPTTPFDAFLCTGGSFSCLDQPNGSALDALEGILMNRVQYRNFGSYESIVLNHPVDVGNNIAGIRWYELRRDNGGAWYIRQEGTFSPDNTNRWNGSISMDGAGNMAMAYTVMDNTVKPSLRYTGRKASDVLGQMSIDEFQFGNGVAYQQGNRWGDYSAMAVDPSDDRTFWYTGEYMKGNGQWGTKIVTFQIARDTNDVSPQALVTPVNSPDLGNSEAVTVQFKNNGLVAQSNIPVGYVFENNAAVFDTIFTTLEPDSLYNLTFAVPVDMSVIQPYQFTVFTGLANDGNLLNDTLRLVVSKLPRYDASVKAINNIPDQFCGESVIASIVVKNEGADTLNSFSLVWQLNGGTPDTLNWTGVLLPGATIAFDQTLTNLIGGPNSLSAYTYGPNGELDENTANDALSRDFTALLNGADIRLELRTDNYPEETTWELKDLGGNVLYSGGPYSQGGNTYVEHWCLNPDSCYVFTILDSYGDGLSVGFPQDGTFNIYDVDNNVMATLGPANFGSEASFNFCGTYVCVLTINATISKPSSPTSNNGSILLQPLNAVSPIQYSIDGGANFQSTPLFSNLLPGTYEVVITDATGCSGTTTIVLGFCTLEAAFTVTNASQGQSNGKITITPNGGTAPYRYSKNSGPYLNNGGVFSALAAGNYYICVKDADNCVYCDSVTVDVNSGVQGSIQGQSVALFPNPTHEDFTLEITGLNGVSSLLVDVFDATGRKLTQARLSRWNGKLTTRIDLGEYPDGIYFIRINHPDMQRLLKVVKI